MGKLSKNMPADDMRDLTTYTIEELEISRNHWRAKIDGPENDGRLTSDSSADLDYWMYSIEAIAKEIARRDAHGIL